MTDRDSKVEQQIFDHFIKTQSTLSNIHTLTINSLNYRIYEMMRILSNYKVYKQGMLLIVKDLATINALDEKQFESDHPIKILSYYSMYTINYTLYTKNYEFAAQLHHFCIYLKEQFKREFPDGEIDMNYGVAIEVENLLKNVNKDESYEEIAKRSFWIDRDYCEDYEDDVDVLRKMLDAERQVSELFNH